MSRSERIWRLLKILHLAANNERLNAAKMSEQLGVSKRTFHRDRKVLEEAGLPVAYDGEGYRLVGGPFLPAVQLRWDEALSLMLAVQGVLEAESVPFSDSLREALDKVQSGITPQVHHKITQVASEVQIKPRRMVDMSAHRGTFHKLCQAIEEHRVVKIDYLGRSDRESTIRNIEPMGVFQRWRAWYVVAHCRLRSDIRIFRIDRMSSARVTGDRFVPQRGFDLDEFLAEAWLVEHGDPCQIRIRFSGESARLVTELDWHPSQKIISEGDSHVVLQFYTSGLRELADWVMGFGAEAKILEPPKLREMVVETSREILAVYEGPS